MIKGNAAVVKCKIPSFVADFVQIEAWVDEEGLNCGAIMQTAPMVQSKQNTFP